MRRLITLSALFSFVLLLWSCTKESINTVEVPQLSIEESNEAYISQIREDVVFQVNYYNPRTNTHAGWAINNKGEIGQYADIQPPSLHPEYPLRTYDQFLQMAERANLTGLNVDNADLVNFHQRLMRMEYEDFALKANPAYQDLGIMLSVHGYRDETPRGIECDSRDRLILIQGINTDQITNQDASTSAILDWLKGLETEHGLSN